MQFLNFCVICNYKLKFVTVWVMSLFNQY